MLPIISVIVPVYQVEKYLAECIDSILKQTLHNLEIILVDDGSTDRSGHIADQYADRYSNVKVIHQKNLGLGPARNTGIAVASGTYVGFVDSDDWITPCMYEKLYAAALEYDADIVVSGHCVVSDGVIIAEKIHPMAGKCLSTAEEICHMRQQLYGHRPAEKAKAAFPVSACMSLYRRDMICRNNVLFNNIMSEDMFFNLCAYRCAKRIAITDATDYRYRRDGQTSITSSFSESTIKKYIYCLQTLKDWAELEDEMAVLRVKRKSIDYCRLYVTSICNTSLSYTEKKKRIGKFMENEILCGFWSSYPLWYLPFLQGVFHWFLTHGWYRCAIFLSDIKNRNRKKC